MVMSDDLWHSNLLPSIGGSSAVSTCFNDFGLLRQGFEPLTFRMQGECSNRLPLGSGSDDLLCNRGIVHVLKRDMYKIDTNIDKWYTNKKTKNSYSIWIYVDIIILLINKFKAIIIGEKQSMLCRKYIICRYVLISGLQYM